MLNNMEKISGPVHVMKINHAIIAEILCLRKTSYRPASDRKTYHKYLAATTRLNLSHSQPIQRRQWYTYCKPLGETLQD